MTDCPPSPASYRSSRSGSDPNQLRPTLVVFAKSNPLAPVPATRVSIAFQDLPAGSWYEVGAAVSSASTRPSDSCQKRAAGVRREVSSLTRSAFGAFFPLGSFCRSATPRPPYDGGSGFSSSSSPSQSETVSKTPLPPSCPEFDGGAA